MVKTLILFIFATFSSYFVSLGHFYKPNYDSWTLVKYEEMFSRNEAKKHCEQNNGLLAIFHKKKSLDAIAQKLNGKHYL